MSEWVKRRGEAHLQKTEEKQRIEDFIIASNYWQLLMKQIESDINYINTESAYAIKLKREPIRITSPGFGGYEIQNRRAPATFLLIENKGREIHTKWKIFSSPNDENPRERSEKLKVVSDGEHVYL